MHVGNKGGSYMFWTKCEKIIAKGNQLIDCNNCPCGYYALFAFKKYNMNQTTKKIDSCSYSISVAAHEVIDNAIQAGDYCRRCISINRTPNDKDVVGSDKGCYCCYSYCVNGYYDENDQWICTDNYESCEDCSEIVVYRLSPCFDKYEDFAEWFYSGCGISPDSNGRYPNIFDEWYGQKYMSGSALNCVYCHWQGVAEKKLKTYCLIDYKLKSFSWRTMSYAGPHITEKCSQEYIQCYKECEKSSCEEYGDNGCERCSDGSSPKEYCYSMGCEIYAYTAMLIYYQNGITDDTEIWGDSIGGYPYQEEYDGNYYWTYSYPTCCDYKSNLSGSLSSINSWINGKKDERASYSWVHEDSITEIPNNYGYNYCFGRSYGSSVSDWQASIYGGYQVFVNRCCAEFTIRKHENTPPGATGVKVNFYLRDKKGHNNFTASGPSEEILNDGIMTIKFNEPFELPIADNFLPVKLDTIENGMDFDCNADCEGQTPYPQVVPKYVDRVDDDFDPTIQNIDFNINVLDYSYE